MSLSTRGKQALDSPISVYEIRVHIQDDNGEWVDFTDKVSKDTQGRLLVPGSIRYRSESIAGGSHMITSINNVVMDNSDGFFSAPFPSTLKTINGNDASFSLSEAGNMSVLSGKRLRIVIRVYVKSTDSYEETTIGTFIINKYENNNNRTTIEIYSLSQVLNKLSAENVKKFTGWYRNRPVYWLVSELLKGKYFRSVQGDDQIYRMLTPLGTNIQRVINIPTIDGSFVLSHYGQPPEGIDTSSPFDDEEDKWNDESDLISRAIAAIEYEGENQLVIGAGREVWRYKPSTDLYYKIGELNVGSDIHIIRLWQRDTVEGYGRKDRLMGVAARINSIAEDEDPKVANLYDECVVFTVDVTDSRVEGPLPAANFRYARTCGYCVRDGGPYRASGSDKFVQQIGFAGNSINFTNAAEVYGGENLLISRAQYIHIGFRGRTGNRPFGQRHSIYGSITPTVKNNISNSHVGVIRVSSINDFGEADFSLADTFPNSAQYLLPTILGSGYYSLFTDEMDIEADARLRVKFTYDQSGFLGYVSRLNYELSSPYYYLHEGIVYVKDVSWYVTSTRLNEVELRVYKFQGEHMGNSDFRFPPQDNKICGHEGLRMDRYYPLQPTCIAPIDGFFYMGSIAWTGNGKDVSSPAVSFIHRFVADPYPYAEGSYYYNTAQYDADGENARYQVRSVYRVGGSGPWGIQLEGDYRSKFNTGDIIKIFYPSEDNFNKTESERDPYRVYAMIGYPGDTGDSVQYYSQINRTTLFIWSDSDLSGVSARSWYIKLIGRCIYNSLDEMGGGTNFRPVFLDMIAQRKGNDATSMRNYDLLVSAYDRVTRSYYILTVPSRTSSSYNQHIVFKSGDDLVYHNPPNVKFGVVSTLPDCPQGFTRGNLPRGNPYVKDIYFTCAGRLYKISKSDPLDYNSSNVVEVLSDGDVFVDGSPALVSNQMAIYSDYDDDGDGYPDHDIVWGIAGPSRYPEMSLNAQGKYYLWKYDKYVNARVELADFSGLSRWEAISKLAQAYDYITGFDREGNFFFIPRVYDVDSDSIAYTFSEASGEFFPKVSIESGYDEIYNKVVCTPSYVKVGDLSYELQIVPRDTSEIEVGGLTYTEEDTIVQDEDIALSQITPKQNTIRLVCVDGGDVITHNNFPRFKWTYEGRQIQVRFAHDIDSGATSFYISSVYSGSDIDDMVTAGDFIIVVNPDTDVDVVRRIVSADSDTNSITIDSAFGVAISAGTEAVVVKSNVSDSSNTRTKWSDEGVAYVVYNDQIPNSTDTLVLNSVRDLSVDTLIQVKDTICRVKSVNRTDSYIKLKLANGTEADTVLPYDFGDQSNIVGTTIRAWFSPYVKVNDTSNKFQEIGGSGIKMRINPVRESSVIPGPSFFKEGDTFVIKSEGFVSEPHPSERHVYVNQSSISLYGERKYELETNRFYQRYLSKYNVYRIGSNYKHPRYKITINYGRLLGWFDLIYNGDFAQIKVISPRLFPRSPGFSRTGVVREVEFNLNSGSTRMVIKDLEPY